MGRLERIWIKTAHGGPMEAADEAALESGAGIAGDANRGGRQVTLLSVEGWADVLQRLGADVDPVRRRANLLLSGIDLEDSKGRILRVGSCRLKVRGETKPCQLMDRAHQGLREAMEPHWGGGAYADILEDGTIRTGDPVGWADR